MKKVIVELTNGIVFETKINNSEWNAFYEWLENTETVEHYTVDNL